MTKKQKGKAFVIYLILAAMFIASLVSSNLIFQKFVYWDPWGLMSTYKPFGLEKFEFSVGLMPYPITFLITDILSEIYGRKRANQVVIAGLFASLFTLLIVYTSELAPATSWSPLNNEIFEKVFGLSFAAVGASMAAYIVAQFIDIRIFHFWKTLTKGKHLWLRNNASTFVSQFVDTSLVLLLLCSLNVLKWDLFGLLLLNGVLFKILVAALDTPLFYLTTWVFRRKFNLELGEEIDFLDDDDNETLGEQLDFV